MHDGSKSLAEVLDNAFFMRLKHSYMFALKRCASVFYFCHLV